MKTIFISNPNDVCYPFSKEWYDDPYILYHGTSNIHSESIEKNGWNVNEQPYEIKDFQKICKLFEDIGWDGTSKNSGHSVLRSYTVGGGDDYVNEKFASFSQDYWTARNFSRYVGGESIHYLFLAIEDILNISENNQLQDEHRDFLTTELNELLELQKQSKNPETLNYGVNHYQSFLDNFSSSFFNDVKTIATEILRKYDILKKKHFPIVYVLKVNPKWFENYEVEFDDQFGKNTEIRSQMNIPASSVIARIDFPNGVEFLRTSSNGSQPVLWDKISWNEHCIEHGITDFQI